MEENATVKITCDIQKRFLVSSGDIREMVFARNQFHAFQTLRDRPAEDFGMITLAELNEDGDPYIIRTSVLMFLWGRDADAARFITRMTQLEEVPDTTDEDRLAAQRAAWILEWEED